MSGETTPAVCARCGYTSGRLGRWFHTFFGWRWWSFRKDLRCLQASHSADTESPK